MNCMCRPTRSIATFGRSIASWPCAQGPTRSNVAANWALSSEHQGEDSPRRRLAALPVFHCQCKLAGAQPGLGAGSHLASQQPPLGESGRKVMTGRLGECKAFVEMSNNWARPRRYRLVLRGELGDSFAVLFDGMQLQRVAGTTVLIGDVTDQAHLLGLIERAQDLGVELVSVNPDHGTVG